MDAVASPFGIKASGKEARKQVKQISVGRVVDAAHEICNHLEETYGVGMRGVEVSCNLAPSQSQQQEF